MTTIPPMSEEELWEIILREERDLDARTGRLWDIVRILPARWREPSFGRATDGFWAVGVIGTHVVWFNEIEGGFNISRYREHGEIGEYWCNQDTLHWCLSQLLPVLDGTAPFDSGLPGRASPPVRRKG